MMSTPRETLAGRARSLCAAIASRVPSAQTQVVESCAYVGSGSLPTEAMPSLAVTVALPGISSSELARRLRLDRACVFGRIEEDQLLLDVRTLADGQLESIAGALARIA
jgi:L-seryl-tRNA(Ser) seleniumtransferase